MSNAINSIRESVKYARSSQSRGQRFEEMIAQVGIKTNRRPSLDVSTRWNSTYLMLESSLLVRMAFEALDRHDINYSHQPFDYQWIMAEKLCALLKVFYEATVAVSGTLYPTSTCYFHELWKIKMVLDKEATNEDVTIASIVKEMKEKFKKYWDAQYLQICFPVIFDPRYKYKFIEFRLKSAFGAAATPYLKEIKSNMQKLFDEYSAKYGGSNNINSQPETSVEQNVDASNQFADWRQFLHDKSRSKVKSELSRYLADMPQEGDFQDGHDFDILNWWMVNKTKYPVISRMARDVLAILATSVASEAAFSTGERIISDYRSRLSSSTVEALICLQDWMRAEGLGDFFARDLAESDDQNVQHSGI
ncbi:Os12g0521300 [Oryza sativa Japonica Group]|uniref:Os12g0521300 protein n=1 Tax=Oryza sativa subsp. japonica TaxID=39947 RepID=A0A0P0YAL7_ORYSJ|nr:Os12g0521300 [Oryza sativa Japonica Group]